MRNILSEENREILEQLAWSNLLVAFDFDGTLAPIVREPERAVMRGTTRRLLEELARLYPCIVISGRAQADALKRLRGIGLDQVVGNHGIEPWQSTPELTRKVRAWRPRLEQRLARFKGVNVEDKTFSVAVHYRRSREKGKARAAILDVAAALGGVRVIGGKQVVNILPGGASNKGAALERERARLRCDTAIYAGDDETDEDVFALDQPGRLLTIRVGAKRASLARYCIRSQAQIDELMRALIDLRRKAQARRRAPA